MPIITTQQTFVVRGQQTQFDAVKANGQIFIVLGELVRTATIGIESKEWMEDVINPDEVIRELKESRIGVDLFRFWQRIPDCEPKHNYYYEVRHVAAIPIKDYKQWWEKQISPKARNKVRKALKAGVTVEVARIDDELVRGIQAIFNESPIRQNTPFWHYGKDFEATKSVASADMADSIVIAARYQNELIGFIKLRFADRFAMITMILDKMAHRERAPMNAMISKVVEVCVERKIPYVTYTVWRRGGLAAFQDSNGFQKISVPEYFVPVSWKGALALRLGLHNGIKPWIPEKVTLWLIGLRTKWYAHKYPNAQSSS